MQNHLRGELSSVKPSCFFCFCQMRSNGFPFHSGSKRSVALFRMGGLPVARPDILSLLKLKVSLCDRHNTFASFSAVNSHFLWQAQHFGDLHRHCAWQAWDIVGHSDSVLWEGQYLMQIHCVAVAVFGTHYTSLYT